MGLRSAVAFKEASPKRIRGASPKKCSSENDLFFRCCSTHFLSFLCNLEVHNKYIMYNLWVGSIGFLKIKIKDKGWVIKQFTSGIE